MYRERMNSYYPQVIQAIAEFNSIIDGEYPEFEEISLKKERITTDAYLLTMTEDRIKQWEKVFGITPYKNSTVEDRREVIIARIRGQGKLNTEMIKSIVSTFTGGSAISWVEDSTLFVKVTPPSGNKQYRFESIEQELSLKIPAHLNLNVSRNYNIWEDVNNTNRHWKEVMVCHETWEDVLLRNRTAPNELNVDKLNNFYLG